MEHRPVAEERKLRGKELEGVKALIYHGPGKKDWESKDDPGIERPADAVVRIDTTTICGTDLHILKGDVPEVTAGRTLGHEAVGTVVETGPGDSDDSGVGGQLAVAVTKVQRRQ